MPVNADGEWAPDLIAKGFEIFNCYKRCVLVDGPRKCVAPDTLVTTDVGLVRIGAMKPPMQNCGTATISKRVLSFNAQGFLSAQATHFHVNPSRRALEIGLENGKRLVVSPDHPLWCSYQAEGHPVFGYRTARYIGRLIKNGRKVFLPFMRHQLPNGEQLPEVTIKINRRLAYYCRHRQMPSPTEATIRLTPLLGYFLGAMCGDGSCWMDDDKGRTRSVGFTNADQECVQMVAKSVVAMGGQMTFRTRYHYGIKGDVPRGLLAACGFNCKSRFKRIPDVVLSSVTVLREFLSGLFDTDGYCLKNGSVGIATISKHLAMDTQDALSAFGIFSVLNLRTYQVNGNPYAIWSVTLYGEEAQRFKDQIGFRISRKQTAGKNLRGARVRFGFPDHLKTYLKSFRCRDLQRKNRFGKNRRWHRSHRWFGTLGNYVPTPAKLKKLVDEFGYTKELQQFTITDKWVAVATVAPCESELLDITVPNEHSFIASGYIHHNSGKSISIDHKICRHLWEVEYAKVGVIARTLKSGKTGAWDDLTGWVIPQWIAANMGFRYVVEPKMEADTKMSYFVVRNYFGGESVCQLHSLEHDQDAADKFKDSRFSLIYLVEADKFKLRSVFTSLRSQLRALGVPFDKHQLICDCNPPEEGEEHFLHDIFIKRQGNNHKDQGPDNNFDKYYQRIQVLLEDNTMLSEEEMAEQLQVYRYDPDLYDRWTRGKWIKYTTEGHFKDVWSQQRHVVGDCSARNPADWDILIPSSNCIELFGGWDLGEVNHAAGIAAKRELPGGTAFDLLDEIVFLDEQISIEEFTLRFMERMDFWETLLKDTYGTKRIRWRHWSDESAFKYKSAADSYDELIVRNASDGRIALSGCPKGRNSVRQRISMVKKLLFTNRIAVSAQLKHTQDMFRNLRPGTRRGEPIDLDTHSREKHIFDAWTYMLASESPMDLERRNTPATSRRLISVPV